MMRSVLVAMFVCSLAVAKLAAQAPVANTPKPADITMHRKVLPPPKSIRPAAAARPSTAEAGPVHAGWKPLHELPSLSLADRNGQAVTVGSSAAGSRHWFLLYRTAACVPCDRLMLALEASTSAELKAGKPYTIVVDSAGPDGLERVHAEFAGLSEATWMADRQKTVATTLKLHGAPMLIAMDGDRVAWRIAGSLDSTGTVVHLTDAWLAQNAKKTGQVPAASLQQASKAAAPVSTNTNASPTPRQ